MLFSDFLLLISLCLSLLIIVWRVSMSNLVKTILFPSTFIRNHRVPKNVLVQFCFFGFSSVFFLFCFLFCFYFILDFWKLVWQSLKMMALTCLDALMRTYSYKLVCSYACMFTCSHACILACLYAHMLVFSHMLVCSHAHMLTCSHTQMIICSHV